MPKVGMEATRRKALIEATIFEIGAQGSLDVTVGQIAGRAGVSSGLAHHYFGNKNQILLAAMRHLLKLFGTQVGGELAKANGPLERLEGIIEASFHTDQFAPETVAAWLAFYVQAQKSPDAARLLSVYTRRLHSNLMHDLRKLTTHEHAGRVALALGALIDGFYIRQALNSAPPGRETAVAMLHDYLSLQLARSKAA